MDTRNTSPGCPPGPTASDQDPTLDESGACIMSGLQPYECACRVHTSAPTRGGRTRTGPPRHRWSRDDETVVAGVYLERESASVPASVKAELADLIGCSPSSIAYKLGNIHAYVTGQGALDHGSRQMCSVLDQLCRATEEERSLLVHTAHQNLRSRR